MKSMTYWYQFFTRCEELVPILLGVKFTKCEIYGSTLLTCAVEQSTVLTIYYLPLFQLYNCNMQNVSYGISSQREDSDQLVIRMSDRSSQSVARSPESFYYFPKTDPTSLSYAQANISYVFFYVEVKLCISCLGVIWPATMAHLDARPTGDLGIAGSTPAGSATFFRGDLIMKFFLRPFSPFRLFKKGSCRFLTKECAQYWLTA